LDVEERLTWAYIAKKTEAQLRSRLIEEDDSFVLGELVDRAVGTLWLDDLTYAHIRTVGGRALMHAAIDPNADNATVDAFAAVVLDCEDPVEYRHICHPMTVEWVTCQFAAAHPRVLPELLAHTVRHALVSDIELDRSLYWLNGRPHILEQEHITDSRARLQHLTPAQDRLIARLWWALSLASPTVSDWDSLADVYVRTLQAIGTLPPRGQDFKHVLCDRLWEGFPGTVGDLFATVDALTDNAGDPTTA
jgi:hypothetical protein